MDISESDSYDNKNPNFSKKTFSLLSNKPRVKLNGSKYSIEELKHLSRRELEAIILDLIEKKEQERYRRHKSPLLHHKRYDSSKRFSRKCSNCHYVSFLTCKTIETCVVGI